MEPSRAALAHLLCEDPLLGIEIVSVSHAVLTERQSVLGRNQSYAKTGHRSPLPHASTGGAKNHMFVLRGTHGDCTSQPSRRMNSYHSDSKWAVAISRGRHCWGLTIL